MKQMIVHCTQHTTRMALLENGRLVEYAAERDQQQGLVGSYYKGRVMNVLPGMQAAFVDIGQKKNAFLYVDDVLHPHLEKQPEVKPSIETLLQPGQEIVVQVRKEPRGGKGARVTTHYTLPGRWMVYMPFAEYVGVSKKSAANPSAAGSKPSASGCARARKGSLCGRSPRTSLRMR